MLVLNRIGVQELWNISLRYVQASFISICCIKPINVFATSETLLCLWHCWSSRYTQLNQIPHLWPLLSFPASEIRWFTQAKASPSHDGREWAETHPHFFDGLGPTETTGDKSSHRWCQQLVAAHSHWSMSGRCSCLTSQVPIHGQIWASWRNHCGHASVWLKRSIALTERGESC